MGISTILTHTHTMADDSLFLYSLNRIESPFQDKRKSEKKAEKRSSSEERDEKRTGEKRKRGNEEIFFFLP